MRRDLDAVVIYGLVDPHDGSIRYVGQTRQRTADRLRQHLWECRRGHLRSYLHEWLRELVSDELLPGIEVLEITNAEQADERERYWIRKIGHDRDDFLNTTTYQRPRDYHRLRAAYNEQKRRTEERRQKAREAARAERERKSAVPRLSSEEIRSFRDRHGLSQADLARRLGYHFSTVSLWESGQRKPPPGLKVLLDELSRNL